VDTSDLAALGRNGPGQFPWPPRSCSQRVSNHHHAHFTTDRCGRHRITRFEYDRLGRRTHRLLAGGTLNESAPGNPLEKTTYSLVPVPGPNPPLYTQQRQMRDFRAKTTT
jgi:YD repeat-containing protein